MLSYCSVRYSPKVIYLPLAPQFILLPSTHSKSHLYETLITTMLWTSALSLAFAAGALAQGGVTVTNDGTTKVCTVNAIGNNQDDVPNILSAFTTCGTNARVVFPATQTYWIGTRLNPVLSNVDIEWRGTWLVCFIL